MMRKVGSTTCALVCEETGVASALTGCLRLSRSIKDHLNTAMFLWELLYKKRDVMRALYPDVADLTVEAQTFLLKTSHQRKVFR